MQKTKIVFVILQYMASGDTLECVASIREHVDIEEYKIIIVDNCSPDDSFEVVQEAFGADGDVVLIHSEENLGFARGNNLGYRYALENLEPEYIIMLNNDILLFQDGIYDVLSDCYRRHEFAVMGPMIYTADALYNSSPMLMEGWKGPEDAPLPKDAFDASIADFRRKLFLIKLHIYRPIRLIVKSYRLFIKEEKENGGVFYFQEHVNYRLHGSFMIFSKRYQEAFPDGLDDRTFMYDEEYFLQYHVIKAGLKLLYSPQYQVFHKEDASTCAMLHTFTKKSKFQMEGMIRSRTRYRKMLEEDEAQKRNSIEM